jgi:hypothetical protein
MSPICKNNSLQIGNTSSIFNKLENLKSNFLNKIEIRNLKSGFFQSDFCFFSELHSYYMCVVY